jgi:hypothetical protein
MCVNVYLLFICIYIILSTLYTNIMYIFSVFIIILCSNACSLCRPQYLLDKHFSSRIYLHFFLSAPASKPRRKQVPGMIAFADRLLVLCWVLELIRLLGCRRRAGLALWLEFSFTFNISLSSNRAASCLSFLKKLFKLSSTSIDLQFYQCNCIYNLF